MATLGVPGQGKFLDELGFSVKCGPNTPQTLDTSNHRNLALIISNFQASRTSSKEPTSTSKVVDIERRARKARAWFSLRYQLIETQVSAGDTYNPLETIRDRRNNNYKAPRCSWDVSNDEMIHDLSYRRSRERAIPPRTREPKSPYQHHRESRHGSQFLISRLQEKHGADETATHDGFGSDSAGTTRIGTDRLVVPGSVGSSGGFLSATSLLDSSSEYCDPHSEGHSEAHIDLRQSESEHSERSGSVSGGTSDGGISAGYLKIPQGPGSALNSTSALTPPSSHSLDALDFNSHPDHLERAQNELAYIVSVLEAALRQKCCDAPEIQQRCQKYTHNLQEYVVPQYLEFLGQSEKMASQMEGDIDTRLVAPTEQLKLEADRVIADINTNLNLKLRDCATMMTELERTGGSDCVKHLGYLLLEWTVAGVLRCIWGICCLWLGLRWIALLITRCPDQCDAAKIAKERLSKDRKARQNILNERKQRPSRSRSRGLYLPERTAERS